MKFTEPIGFVRASADDPHVLEGIAVPYGAVSRPTELLPGSGEIVREAWAPGAFAADIEAWRSQANGRKAPYRATHGGPAIGVVENWTDTPQGVAFRASIFDRPAGNDYLADVAAGLNGVSVEGMWEGRPKRMKDGTILHRSGKLHGLAGSDHPAYDGAVVALRDMEAAMGEEDKSEAAQAERAEAAQDKPADIPKAERAAAERGDARAVAISQSRAPAQITRAEAVYGPWAVLPDGSQPSFLRDLYRAQFHNDASAGERADRHQRQLDDLALQIERASDVLVAEIPGMYPNEYVPGLLTPRILKGRPMGGFFNRVTIADARPRIFAKVTTSGAVVTAADGAALTATDVATTAVTVTPAIYGTYTDISRAAFDGGDPSTEQMVINDLVEGYAQASETVIKTAVEAGASASGTAITAATPFAGTLGNVIKYYTTRFRPAQAQFIPSALFAVLLAEADTAGRPKMPLLNPQNSDATVNTGGVNGMILGSTTYLSYASTTNVVVTTRAEDYVIFESSVARFSFSEVVGPTSVRVGIWAYLGVGTRLGGLSVTAA